MAASVSAPRLHDQLLPATDCFVENYTWGHTTHHMSAAAVSSLKSRGQSASPASRGIGVSQAVLVDYSGRQGIVAGGGSTHLGTVAGKATGLGAGSGSGSRSSSGSSKGVLIAKSDSRKDGAPAGYG